MKCPECGSESLVPFSGMDVVFYRWICLNVEKCINVKPSRKSDCAREMKERIESEEDGCF